MIPKERVRIALKHKQPDRPPISASVTPQIGMALNKMLGIENDGLIDSFFANRISFTKALIQLGNDSVSVAACVPEGYKPTKNDDGTITDEWGITSHDTGMYSEMVGHPLADVETIDDLDLYSFPDPLAKGRFDHAEKTIEEYDREYAIIGEQECTLFELSWYLTGFEKFLMDMTLQKPYIFELLDRVMEINLKQACRLVEMGSDIILTGDDMGTQNGMLLAPEQWRSIFKPRMQYFFNTLKEINPDIQIAYHSCGSIRPIIPDLMEIGLDILNPIQPLARDMDAESLKKEFGNKLSFYGGIDIQQLLPKGTPAEIQAVVREKKKILGEMGGYILGPAHNIQPDTPMENILAFFETAREV
ncbi:uroporphyrinogen decarboxylase family protein [bacterium]